MEKTKVCFKCRRELPISQFYKHPQTSDGHLNKCKDCVKSEVKIRAERNKEKWSVLPIPEQGEKRCAKCGKIKPLREFQKHSQALDGHACRCKECSRDDDKLKYLKNSQDPSYMERERNRGREKYRRLGYRTKLTDACLSKREKYPRLRNARSLFKAEIPKSCELHHWNYNDNNNIIVLDRSLHHRTHSIIQLNVDLGFYYFKEKPLDTIEKHLEVIRGVCDEYGFDFSKVKVLSR